eukprot:1582489-Rhodomonas_salina.1
MGPRKTTLAPASLSPRTMGVDEWSDGKEGETEGVGGSEIFMTKHRTYCLEGTEAAEVWASRAGSCEETVRVRWCIAGSDEGGGTAVEGEHYVKSAGEFLFPPHSSISSQPAVIPLIASEFWEPIREFTVVLEEVVCGPAGIGKLRSTVVTIVERDL